MFRFSMSLQSLRRLLIVGGFVFSTALASAAQAATPPNNGPATYDIMQHSSCCYTGDPIAANQSLWHAFFETPATPAIAPGVTLTQTQDLSQLNNFDMLYIAQSNIDVLSPADMALVRDWAAAGGILVINEHESGNGASAFGTFLGPTYTFSSTGDPSGNNIVVTDASHRLVTAPNVLTGPELSNWGSSVHGAFDSVGSAYSCAANSTDGETSLPVLCSTLFGSGAVILTGFDPECGSGCHDSHVGGEGGGPTGGANPAFDGGINSHGSELWENFVLFIGAAPAADPAPEANLIVNGNVFGEEVTVGNPVSLEFFLRLCGVGQELFLVMKAPAMGINVFSYLTMTGQWVPLPGDLSLITPFRLAPADGRHPLFTGTVPRGVYDIYFGCDFVKNGHLDYQFGHVDGAFDHVVVTVQ